MSCPSGRPSRVGGRFGAGQDHGLASRSSRPARGCIPRSARIHTACRLPPWAAVSVHVTQRSSFAPLFACRGDRCGSPTWSRAVTFLANILSANLALLRDLPRAARIALFLFLVAGLAD